MSGRQQFSDVTKQYLCCFYEIPDEMIGRMCGAELTDSIGCNFIVQMIPHHRAAIGMSRNLLQYTTLVPLQMIPHHEGAVRMPENALHYPICGELVPILQAIITSQKRGIREMEQLLRCI